MDYKFIPITFEYAKKISEWQYTGFMKTVYMKPYFDNYEKTRKLIGPGNCEGFVVIKDNKVFGIFEFYHPEEELEIGLAINPEFTGKGLAKDYVLAGIKFGVNYYKYKKDTVKLFVAKENVPAYKAYINAGFVEVKKVREEILMKCELK